MSTQNGKFLSKKAVFSLFCAFFRKKGTPKVTIFYICQCEKWTNSIPKTVEISKFKYQNWCKMLQGAKKLGENYKKIC